MNKIKNLIIVSTLAGVASVQGVDRVDNNQHEEHNFNNRSLEPFKVCTTRGGNYARVVGNRAKFVWKEAEYRPRQTRGFLGAEICAERALGTHEMHTGFTLNVPTPGGGVRFPTTKNTIIWQNFMLGGCSSWGGVMEIRNNDLWIVHRHFCTPNPTERRILRGIQRNRNYQFQTHTKVSRNRRGFVSIQIDGRNVYRNTNINHGFGAAWKNNNELAANSKQEQKIGMYAADVARHSRDEIRTIYFDNWSVFNAGGSRGWNIVDPRR